MSGGLGPKVINESVDDESSMTVDIPGGSHGGHGIVRAGDAEQFATFEFNSAGDVIFINKTMKVKNADIDTNLCLIPNGAADGVEVKNRLGTTKNIHVRFTGS